MAQGVVKKVVAAKGFGFIESDRQDLFFHCSSVEGAAFEDLVEGTQVTFTEEDGPRGSRAVEVRPISGAPLVANGVGNGGGEETQGVIKKVVADRGFGFIEADGRDIFFHCSQVRDAEFETLQVGQTVFYRVGRGPHGPRAEDVRLGDQSPAPVM